MSTAEHTATEKRDVYATVTAQIINAIEQGVINSEICVNGRVADLFGSPNNLESSPIVNGQF